MYESEAYRNAEDPNSTRGKYNTHRPHAPPDAHHSTQRTAVDVELRPTPSRDFGPFFVELAPFRGVLTPMGHVATPIGDKPAPGDWLLVKGTVYSHAQRSGIAYAVLDIWQVRIAPLFDVSH